VDGESHSHEKKNTEHTDKWHEKIIKKASDTGNKEYFIRLFFQSTPLQYAYMRLFFN